MNAPPVSQEGTGYGKQDISPRTWFFFYLISLVAILWATFLLVREEMVWLSFALVIIAAGSGMFLFIHDIKIRTLFFFYLICLVALLWAVFLLMRDEMAWVSLFLVLVSAGTAIFVYFLVDQHLIPGPGTSKNPGPVVNPGNPDPGFSMKTGDLTDPEEV